MSKDSRRAFYLDGDTVVAESDVIRLAVGDDEHNLRSDVWTFFGSGQKSDFYLTSSAVSRDQKGSIHRTRGQFGYTTQMWPHSYENWNGPLPTSRHLEVIDIPTLNEGDHFHVMTIRIPGIGLRKTGRPALRPKPFVLLPSFGADTCMSLNLFVFEGDPTEFIRPLPGLKAVAAVCNQDRRSLIIFMGKHREQDHFASYSQLLNSHFAQIFGNKSYDDLSLFSIYRREPHQPIVFLELHNISVTSKTRD